MSSLRMLLTSSERMRASALCGCTMFLAAALTPMVSAVGPQEFRLTNLSADLDESHFPFINGDNVVWVGKRGTQFELFHYHIPSATRSTLLSSTHSFDDRLAIDGNYVAWSDIGISLHNLSTGVTTTLSTDSRASVPEISGNNIVWLEGREQDSRRRIMRYNIDTMIMQQLVTFGPRDELRISGNDLVWDQRVGTAPSTAEIFHYSLLSGTTTRLTNNSIPDVFPEVSDRNVVWQTWDGEPAGEIFRRNLQTGVTERLTTDSEPDRTPEISGPNVVWQGGVGGNGGNNVFHRNLLTGETSQLTHSVGYPERHGVPDVEGLSIVWQAYLDNDSNNSEIFFHDLAARVTSRVTNDGLRDEHAFVYGNNIVFQRERPFFTNKWDNYLATPIPELSTNALIGLAGLIKLVAFRKPRRRHGRPIPVHQRSKPRSIHA